MIKKEIIDTLIKSKDANVKAMAEEYKFIIDSPYYDTYITMLTQLRDWNKQLKLGETETINIGGISQSKTKGRIDLFAEGDDKSFDRAFKYFSQVVELTERIDELRKKLTPAEKSSADMVTGTAYEGALDIVNKKD